MKNVIDNGEIKKSSLEGGKVQVTVNGEKMVRENLGCWKDSRNRAIQPIEGTHYLIKDNYHSRTDAVNKCLKAALAFGYTVFAVQNGGWCASAEDAEDTYKKYGRSGGCGSDGEGGGWANEVYKIERELNNSHFSSFKSLVTILLTSLFCLCFVLLLVVSETFCYKFVLLYSVLANYPGNIWNLVAVF